MSELRKADPLEEWLYKFFKTALFVTAVAGIYHLIDRELQVSEFLASLVNLRVAKISGVVLSAGFALYLQVRRSRK